MFTNLSSPILSVCEVSKAFPNAEGLKVVSSLSLKLYKGEFLCIVGPSGSGKTTLLRMMAGLLAPTSGKIIVNGHQISDSPQDVILLFQEYSRSLLPWRRVLPNVELGLEARKMSYRQRKSISRHFLNLVGLSDFEQHFPWQLSGGMQQRVALARALACRPKVLLMDEPFGSLDARTREDLEDQLLRIWSELQLSIVFVTHDIDEAIYLGQRIILLSKGPATIRSIEEVELGYPRHQLTTRQDRKFLEIRAKVYKNLRAE